MEGERKILVVGGKGCGKTSLIEAFASGDPDYVDDSDRRHKIFNFGRERVDVALEEGVGDSNYSYGLGARNVKAVLVCFAFDDSKSIESVSGWLYWARLYVNDSDHFVVGCKEDQKHRTAVSEREWMDLERTIGGCTYLECSAKTGEGVDHLVRVVGQQLADQLREENAMRTKTSNAQRE